MAIPLLPSYGARQRRAQPTAHIQVPPDLHKTLYANGLEVCHETAIDGNCGVHGFALSLRAVGLTNKRLSATLAYKELLKHISNADAVVPFSGFLRTPCSLAVFARNTGKSLVRPESLCEPYARTLCASLCGTLCESLMRTLCAGLMRGIP